MSPEFNLFIASVSVELAFIVTRQLFIRKAPKLGICRSPLELICRILYLRAKLVSRKIYPLLCFALPRIGTGLPNSLVSSLTKTVVWRYYAGKVLQTARYLSGWEQAWDVFYGVQGLALAIGFAVYSAGNTTRGAVLLAFSLPILGTAKLFSGFRGARFADHAVFGSIWLWKLFPPLFSQEPSWYMEGKASDPLILIGKYLSSEHSPLDLFPLITVSVLPLIFEIPFHRKLSIIFLAGNFLWWFCILTVLFTGIIYGDTKSTYHLDQAAFFIFLLRETSVKCPPGIFSHRQKHTEKVMLSWRSIFETVIFVVCCLLLASLSTVFFFMFVYFEKLQISATNGDFNFLLSLFVTLVTFAGGYVITWTVSVYLAAAKLSGDGIPVENYAVASLVINKPSAFAQQNLWRRRNSRFLLLGLLLTLINTFLGPVMQLSFSPFEISDPLINPLNISVELDNYNRITFPKIPSRFWVPSAANASFLEPVVNASEKLKSSSFLIWLPIYRVESHENSDEGKGKGINCKRERPENYIHVQIPGITNCSVFSATMDATVQVYTFVVSRVTETEYINTTTIDDYNTVISHNRSYYAFDTVNAAASLRMSIVDLRINTLVITGFTMANESSGTPFAHTRRYDKESYNCPGSCAQDSPFDHVDFDKFTPHERFDYLSFDHKRELEKIDPTVLNVRVNEIYRRRLLYAPNQLLLTLFVFFSTVVGVVALPFVLVKDSQQDYFSPVNMGRVLCRMQNTYLEESKEKDLCVVARTVGDKNISYLCKAEEVKECEISETSGDTSVENGTVV